MNNVRVASNDDFPNAARPAFYAPNGERLHKLADTFRWALVSAYYPDLEHDHMPGAAERVTLLKTLEKFNELAAVADSARPFGGQGLIARCMSPTFRPGRAYETLLGFDNDILWLERSGHHNLSAILRRAVTPIVEAARRELGNPTIVARFN